MKGRLFRFSSLYAAAWFPYAVCYYLIFALNPALKRIAFTETLYNIVPAGLLGIVALKWCRLVGWNQRKRIWFYPVQIVSAIIYSVSWAISVQLLSGLIGLLLRHPLSFSSWGSYALQWQLFSGLMIYGNLAGFSYVAQANRELVAEEKRRTEAEALRNKAELLALRSQLNPHFLFNSLHTLSALIDADRGQAKQALFQLADMLRYTLGERPEDDESDVSLSAELRFTDLYLALEALRLGDRLNVEQDIAPDTFCCRLPPLTIQPLVENAVKHGISPRIRAGKLRICVSKQSEKLVIVISDDGAGCSPHLVATSNGFGVRNVKQRLDHYTHGTSTFVIETGEEQGFTVKLSIPQLEQISDSEPI